MDESILVRYSQVSPKALQKVITDKYELKSPVTCRFFDSGLNDIYVVTAGDTKYYLRLGLADRYRRMDYEEEISVLLTLREHKIPVAAPVMCNDGSYLWSVQAPEGERFAVLLEEAKKNNEPKDFFTLGALIAKIHELTDRYQPLVSRPAIDRQQLVMQPLDRVLPYLVNRKSEFEKLTARANELYDIISKELDRNEPYYGFCHGDLHSGNIFFADGKPTFFDFDCMGYGYRAYDLCIYAWNESYNEKAYLESEQWNHIISGYESIRSLSPEEKKLIPAFMALRQVWLMGLHADAMDRNAGCVWFNDGYFTEQISLFDRYYQMFCEKHNIE